MGFFVNHEPIVPIEVLGMLICFGGVIVITLSQSSHSLEGSVSTDGNLRILGIGMIFICSWLNAFTCVLNRKLKGVHHAVVMFWHGCLGLSVAALYIIVEAAVTDNGFRFTLYTTRQNLIMAIASLFDAAAIYCNLLAY